MSGSLNRGFTLFEVIVVFGLLAIVGGFSLWVSLDAYRSSAFRSDRNTIVVALQRARSLAVNNVCTGSNCAYNGKAHGVAIRPVDQPNSYVVFQGASYSSRDTSQDVALDASRVTNSSSLSEIVFVQLSATTSTTGDIVLKDQSGHTSTTTIGSEGQIIWTN